MIKKLFPFLSVIMLALFVGACSSEDVMPDIDQGASSRTVTFEALMPGSGATTRVAAEELADRTIDLTWEENDKIVLLFVQGETRKSATATVVSADGETGTFTVTLPEGIVGTADYTLYGAYGTAGAPAEGSTIVDLASTGDLGNKILLHFEKAVTGNAIGSVDFVHKGYLFTAKVEITGGTVNDINLVGDGAWAIGSSDYKFDLETADFTTTATATNAIELENLVEEGGVATARSWFPALGNEIPALKLNVNGTAVTTEAKPAKTPVAGEAYYLYATYDGTNLVFTDKEFEPGTKIDIADLRAKYVAEGTYAEDHYIEGEVVLNAKNGNVNALAAYVADETAGISFFFTSGDEVVTDAPLGAKVRINLEGATWDSFNGLIQLKLSTDNVEIVEATNSTPLVPRVVTIQDILDGKYQSDLVQISDVQFKDVPATYSGNNALVNSASDEVNVYTRNEAAFADDNVPEGNGPFIGVVGMHNNNAQLHVRKTADLAGMTGPRYVPPFINTDPASLTFAKEGGSETIAVTANVSWTATTEASWLTVTPASGANNGTITVAATENGVDARNATITITDGDVVATVNVTQAGENEVFATDLFFSEYIEGSSNNKFLEIYNGTGASINLSNYKIEHYNNGSTSATYTLNLPDVDLGNNKVYVIANNSASTSIYSGADLTTTSQVMGFNGNDAIVLVKNTTRIDIIGEIGNNANIIKDKTLIRKPHVKEGNAENYSGFPNEEEWSSHGTDYQELGSHTTDY